MNNSAGALPVSWQRIVLITLCIILASILAVMIFLTGYVNRLLSLVSGDGQAMNETLSPEHMATATEYYDPSNPPTGPSISEDEVVQTTLPPIVDTETDHIINILLIGEDRRPGEVRQRSDSMILCSFNTKNNSLTMVSFLRDTYISSIPGYNRPDKLNAAYCWGGATKLNETLAAYFGVHVDANIAVQFEGFIGIIDMLGGVDINLTKREVDFLNIDHAMGWNFTVGMNHLNGEQALAYARIRKIDMDAMRAQRQRNVLTAIINAYKSKPIGEMLTLTTQILETFRANGTLETDMSTNDVLAYVKVLFPRLATCTISSLQIPAEGTYQNVNVGSIRDAKIYDLDFNRLLLKRLFEQ